MAFPSGYTKYQEVTIDATKVSADITDYVVYVDLADLVKAGADIFDTCRTDGGDIRVTKTDGTTELAREVVNIDTTAKTGELHIKFAGTLSSSTDTVIRIYYNGTDTEPTASSTYGSENVWTDYQGVWHLGEASGTRADSTANANTLASNGTGGVGQATGKIGDGADFELGDSDYLSITDASQTGLDLTGDCTLSALVKVESAPPGKYSIFEKVIGSNESYNFNYRESSGKKLQFVASSDGGGGGEKVFTFSQTLTPGTWYRVTMEFDASASTVEVFVNGVSIGTVTQTPLTAIYNGTADFTIGGRAAGNFFDGVIDEARVASKLLGVAYDLASYNNHNSPSTFYSTSEEGGGSSPDVTVTPSTESITANEISVMVQTGTLVSATPESSTVNEIAPTVVAERTVTVTPSTEVLTTSGIQPTIIGDGNISYTVNTPQVATVTEIAPTITTQQNVSIVTVAEDGTITLIEPTVVLNSPDVTVIPSLETLTITHTGRGYGRGYQEKFPSLGTTYSS